MKSDPPPRQAAEATAPEPAPPLLQLDNLSKLYPLPKRWLRRRRFRAALDDVSLFLHKTETLGVVGESGSGKSTLARVTLALTTPDYGQVAFDGRVLTGLSDRALASTRRRIQPVFQNPGKALDPALPVYEAVREAVVVKGSARSLAQQRATAEMWLTRVGISEELRSRRPNALSGGELQRVALARALAMEPDLLVLDEPFNALDVSVRAQLVNLLLDLQVQYSLGYLFISHDWKLVRYMSHRVAVMLAGRIVELGPAHAIGNGAHPYTRALTGLSTLPTVEPPPQGGSAGLGCQFAARCPLSTDRCREQRPSLQPADLAKGHLVACHHPLAPLGSDIARADGAPVSPSSDG